MAWSIDSSGTFTEDFNYGYPYLQPLAPLPGEFSYSGYVQVHSGVLNPPYGRKDFSLQYQDRRAQPKNADRGLHGGSRTDNGYYLMFPVLKWANAETLTLRIHLSDDGQFTYHRSFDGHIGDVHTVVINDKVHESHSHTAGHGWTKKTYDLRKGHNKIQWVLETSYGATVGLQLRNGVASYGGFGMHPQAQDPSLPRYLRISDITITNATHIIAPTESWVNIVGAGAVTPFNPMLNERAQVAITGITSLVDDVVLSRPMFLSVSSSFVTGYLSDKVSSVALIGTSELDVTGSINHTHSSLDAGLMINATGELTVEIPLDTPQSIYSLIRPIGTTVITMPDPVIVGGRPVIPAYRDHQSTAFSSSGGYSYNDALDPSSVNHRLPNNPAYRWIAVDVTGADDDPVTTWPERNGGPSWTSMDPFTPTIHPHLHFNDKGLDYVLYSRVVTFYWRYVQHMWANLGSQPTPFTWTFVGIFSTPSKSHWHHVLSSGNQVPTPGDYSDEVQDSIELTVTENPYNGFCFFGVHDDGIVVRDFRGGLQFVKGHVDWRPVIYTMVVEANKTTVYARHRNHRWKGHSNLTNPNCDKFLLGRESGWIGEQHASHMSLLEVGFHSRALSVTEVHQNENYLMGVYQFEKYI